MLSDWFKECHNKFEEMKLFKLKNDMSNYATMSYGHEMKSKVNDEAYVNSNFSELEREFIRVTMIVEKYLK